LIAHLVNTDSGISSLPERAAGQLRPIISECARDTRPNGKSSAVYKLANLSMKILFQCNKPESVRHIYTSVMRAKRPIADYNRSDRVTYLFYLGRYFYASAQFFAAMRVLEQAYLECDIRALKNRRLILIYLVAASIILGRFPTSSLYDRAEATGFRDRFMDICKAMKLGDLCSFRLLTSLSGPYANWFLHFGILLQIQSRGEVIVWRSLARRTFALRNPPSTNGAAFVTTNSRGQQVAPTLDMKDLHVLMRALAIRVLSPLARGSGIPGQRHTAYAIIDTHTPADLPKPYVDPEFEGVPLSELGITAQTLPTEVPTEKEVEGMVASLISMGLMNGYISHRLMKFAIKGAKERPASQAGWPNVAKVLREKHDSDDLPGINDGVQQGNVIHLSSAAPAGS
jgi:hypothetical protein